MRPGAPHPRLRRIPACVLAAALSSLGSSGPAAAAEPVIVRTSLVPESPWVGQRVILRIEVLGLDAWAQVTRFGGLDVPGAYVLRGNGSGIRLQETIDGGSYSGQRYEWSVYPQRAGTLEIPAIDVQVTQRRFGAGSGETTAAMRTPPARAECRQPPGTGHIRGLISTSQLTATQKWTPQPGAELKVGDALTRSVELVAADISGMAFTPVAPAALDGVGIYPAQPAVEDKSDRGTLTGTRIESVTYVFESPGPVAIPERSIQWWNTRTETLELVQLPGVRVTVTGPATPTPPAGPASGRTRASPWWWIGPGLVTVAILAAFAFRRRIRKRWTVWQRHRQHSEEARFRRLTTAIRSGSGDDALRELMRWIDTTSSGSAPARLDRFLERYGDDGSRALTQQLSRPGSAPVDAESLVRSISAARKRWIADRRHRRQRQRADQVLPPLNPSP